MAKTQKPQQEKKTGASKGSEKLLTAGAVPAVVEDIVGRTGFRGEVTQVRCKIQEGSNTGKLMRRNVRGPIKPGEVLMLRETEIEARKIRSKVSKGAYS